MIPDLEGHSQRHNSHISSNSRIQILKYKLSDMNIEYLKIMFLVGSKASFGGGGEAFQDVLGASC